LHQQQTGNIFTREEKYNEDEDNNDADDNNSEEKSGDDDVVDDQQEEGEYLLGDEGPPTVTKVYIFRYFSVHLQNTFDDSLFHSSSRMEFTKVCSRKKRMKKIILLLDISAMDVT
jgi:hypothetical protein